jgi:cell wall-associated protease
MKVYILIIVIILSGIPGISQPIANNKWKSVFLIPHAVDVILDFKKDTLYLVIEMGQRMGTLIFSQRNDTLMITKISGASPCPEQSTGWYRIEWLENGEKFLLRGISDECEGRIGTFTTNPYERIHDKQ